MDPITIKYQWTVAEYRESMRWNLRQRRPFFRQGCVLLAILFLGCGFYFRATEGITMATLLSFFLAIYLMSILPIIMAVRCWRFKKRPDNGINVEWQITPEKLLIHTTNAHSESNWNIYAKAVQTPKGFLFIQHAQIFQWLPRHAFASEESYAQLAQLAKTRVKVFKQVS